MNWNILFRQENYSERKLSICMLKYHLYCEYLIQRLIFDDHTFYFESSINIFIRLTIWQIFLIIAHYFQSKNKRISHFDISNAHASTSLLSDQNKPVFYSQICAKSEKKICFNRGMLLKSKQNKRKICFWYNRYILFIRHSSQNIKRCDFWNCEQVQKCSK